MYRQDLMMATLNTLRSGKAMEEASEALNNAVNAARDTNKAAEIKLTIKIKPDGFGRYQITDEITAKIPKLPKPTTLLWGTPEGNLQRTDPDQNELDLRVVSDAAKPKTLQPEQAVPAKIVS